MVAFATYLQKSLTPRVGGHGRCEKSCEMATAAKDPVREDGKVIVQFRNVGGAPVLAQQKFKLPANAKFEVAAQLLRSKLGLAAGDHSGGSAGPVDLTAPSNDEGGGAGPTRHRWPWQSPGTEP